MAAIIGRKPVLEALSAASEIEHIYISRGSKGGIIDEIRKSARKQKVKISEVPHQKLDQLAKRKNTQGVIAIKAAADYYDYDKLLDELASKKNALVLILDSVQDPHNVGAILRTAEAAKVDGIVLSAHNSAGITETVEKVSAGAVSHLKIVKAPNLVNLINDLKRCGFWIYGASLENAENYTSIDFTVSTALILGNEEKGIRRLTAANCDGLVKIPMKGKIQSLNVSVSAGILLFEVVRQRTLR